MVVGANTPAMRQWVVQQLLGKQPTGQYAVFRSRGAWAANTAYLAGDVVTNNGIRYVNTIANTSPATFATVVNTVEVLLQLHDASGGGAKAPKIELWTTPGTFTWTKDATASRCEFTAISGGNSGQAGVRNTNTTSRQGGQGGLGGSKSVTMVPASAIPATASVVVGAGGAATADVSANATQPLTGNSGADTYIDSLVEAKAPTWSGLSQITGVGSDSGPASNSSTSYGGTVQQAQPTTNSGAGTGGAGSGLNASNQGSIGAQGGDGECGLSPGRAAPAVNTAPSSYTAITTAPIRAGAGGPGGGTNGATVGAAGAPGQAPGGGGGGGTAGNASFAAKGGGAGAPGAAQIITYY